MSKFAFEKRLNLQLLSKVYPKDDNIMLVIHSASNGTKTVHESVTLATHSICY